MIEFLVAMSVSAALGPWILNTLIRLKSRQTIHKDAPETHQAKAGTPTMGGFIVLVGALAAMPFAGPHALPCAVLLAGFGAIGFVDDYIVPRVLSGKRGLGWVPKLSLQILLGVGAVGLARPTATVWEWGLGLFLVLFFTNAYNFSDGLDGLAGSLGILLALGFVGLTGGLESSLLGPALALIGGLLVFLFFNAPPARVFMGDVGALALGAVLGYFAFFAVTDASSLGSTPQIQWAVAVLLSVVMVAELVPVPIQIFWVKAFKKRLFPFTPIHHAFEKSGWPETRVVYMFVMVQLAVALSAVLIKEACWRPLGSQ